MKLEVNFFPSSVLLVSVKLIAVQNPYYYPLLFFAKKLFLHLNSNMDTSAVSSTIQKIMSALGNKEDLIYTCYLSMLLLV